MAFGTLEDLDDRIDLVFFPRTWEQHRDQVQVDQVMLIIGKVQDKGDQLNIIVDKVLTKLETAQADDAVSDGVDAHVREDGFVPPPVQSNGGAAARRQPQPPPAAILAQPPAQSTGALQSPPPPPPNFDEGDWPADPDSDVEVVEQPEEERQETTLLVADEKPVTAEETYVARSGEVIEVPGNGNHHARTIVVEIKASGNWQETCRRTVKTAKSFPGQDKLDLRFPGQPFQMKFPEGYTDFCEDLIESLERIPGIIRVYSR